MKSRYSARTLLPVMAMLPCALAQAHHEVPAPDSGPIESLAVLVLVAITLAWCARPGDRPSNG